MIGILIAAAAAAMPPEPPISALLDRARLSVPDAREITDLQVCPPSQISPDGREFTVMVALDRPGAVRGYYAAKWQDGRFDRLVPAALVPGGALGDTRGLNWQLGKMLERQTASCRWVSPRELEAAWADLDAR